MARTRRVHLLRAARTSRSWTTTCVQPLANQTSAGLSQRLTSDACGPRRRHREQHATTTTRRRTSTPRIRRPAIRPMPHFGRIDQVQSTSDLSTGRSTRSSRSASAIATSTWFRTPTRTAPTTPRWRASSTIQSEAYDCGPSNGERRHAVVASGSVLLPCDFTLGMVWTAQSQLPWTRDRRTRPERDSSTPISCPARPATPAAAT